MAEFIATFPAGFADVVRDEMENTLTGCRVLHVYETLIHFRHGGGMESLRSLTFLNNVFFVMKAWQEAGSFAAMVREAASGAVAPLIRRGTFRVRFSDAGRFASVDAEVMKKAELQVCAKTQLTVDRLAPRTEVWYIRRQEGTGYYAQLLWRRRVTEKNLKQGELRPEFAFLLCRTIPLTEQTTVCDPFAGSGAIPRQLSHMAGTVYASDADPEKVSAMRDQLPKNVQVCAADAAHLTYLGDDVLDAIITDPPWGLYHEDPDLDTLYAAFLEEARRVIRPGGQLVLLTARKQEMETLAATSAWQITKRIDTLVNGKKAAVFVLE
ncbi:MAG: methyltransferase [Clostridiales bacterium]|nr:methyltransferase [Clostridiales bacterium]